MCLVVLVGKAPFAPGRVCRMGIQSVSAALLDGLVPDIVLADTSR